MNQLTVVPIKLISVADASNGELSDHIYRTCHFCAKQSEFFPINQKINQRLTGSDQFYCQFCLRHDCHTKNSRHVLILSFRSILGYYFQQYYQLQKRMWLSEIKDYEGSHTQIGLQNPVFSYDPETMLWLVNFAKVGISKKKIKIEEVLKTVINILTCFNLPQEVPGLRCQRFFLKYKEAILNFHTRRYRPEDRKMLIPTFVNCGIGETKLDETRHFTFQKLLDMKL